jgi:hypothetical protein
MAEVNQTHLSSLRYYWSLLTINSAFGSGDTAGLYYNGARLAAEQDVVVASIKLVLVFPIQFRRLISLVTESPFGDSRALQLFQIRMLACSISERALNGCVAISKSLEEIPNGMQDSSTK